MKKIFTLFSMFALFVGISFLAMPKASEASFWDNFSISIGIGDGGYDGNSQYGDGYGSSYGYDNGYDNYGYDNYYNDGYGYDNYGSGDYYDNGYNSYNYNPVYINNNDCGCNGNGYGSYAPISPTNGYYGSGYGSYGSGYGCSWYSC